MKLNSLRHPVILTAVLQIGLVILTLSPVFGQSVSGSNNRPLKVEILSQNDSPARITLLDTNTLTVLTENNNTYDSQAISFEIQNVSQKRIRTCVFLLTSASRVTSPGTYTFGTFDPGNIIKTGVTTDRSKLKSDEKLSLSIDYILFSDDTSWGPDSQKDSEHLFGFDEGEKYAISQVKGFLKDKDKEALYRLLQLEQEGKIDNNPPEIDKTKSYKWQRGFLSGYQYFLWQLLPFDEKQELTDVSLKLEKIEKTKNMK